MRMYKLIFVLELDLSTKNNESVPWILPLNVNNSHWVVAIVVWILPLNVNNSHWVVAIVVLKLK